MNYKYMIRAILSYLKFVNYNYNTIIPNQKNACFCGNLIYSIPTCFLFFAFFFNVRHGIMVDANTQVNQSTFCCCFVTSS